MSNIHSNELKFCTVIGSCNIFHFSSFEKNPKPLNIRHFGFLKLLSAVVKKNFGWKILKIIENHSFFYYIFWKYSQNCTKKCENQSLKVLRLFLKWRPKCYIFEREIFRCYFKLPLWKIWNSEKSHFQFSYSVPRVLLEYRLISTWNILDFLY